MKAGFRQSMVWLHTWLGLLLGSLLYFIFLTGTASYFDTEIDRWMRPELPQPTRIAAIDAAALGIRYLQKRAPEADRWYIALPGERSTPYLEVFWQPSGDHDHVQLDGVDGGPLGARDTGGGELLYRMHWKLHYLPSLPAAWLVGVATMVMLIGIVTGVIAHKKIFVDFFTFRPGKGQRTWLDIHNLLGTVALPFHVMITYSGLIFFAATFMPWVIAAHYGDGAPGQRAFFAELQGHDPEPKRAAKPAPLAALAPMVAEAEARWGSGRVQGIDVALPGDMNGRVRLRELQDGLMRSSETMVFDAATGAHIETQPAVRYALKSVADVVLGLHEGLFAGPWLRWLFFLSGLLGTAMIGTGLVLWTVKRRERIERCAPAAVAGLIIVERLNVGTIAGLPVAITAYFWANRLLPLEFAERAAWEAHVMFLVWAALLLHAALRPPARAWIEQAWIAAAACALLPAVNAVTTERHLAATLVRGDWALAGFDLTMLAAGFAVGAVAWRMGRTASAASASAHQALIAADGTRRA